MKLASAWVMTALGAAVVAFMSTKRGPGSSLDLRADMADVMSAGEPAQAFPPQPPDDRGAYLRQMVNELHQENEQLGTLDDQVAALREQLADRQWERRAEAYDDAAQHDATLQALDILRHAEALLADGNSDGVDDELADAETALSGRTLFEVEAAREALSREDLYPARQHIAAALAERRLLR
jgi:hypothetical protein